MNTLSSKNHSLPLRSGVSLKAEHYHTILENKPDVGWFEIHPENYMGQGGLPHYFLSEIVQHYPLSMHGVGLSLGSTQGISETHLSALKTLVDRYQPAQVSEHLSWSHGNHGFLNDLLPLPYTQESLQIICENVDRVQSALGRKILLENPSTYIEFKNNQYSEPDFFKAIVNKTDCGILLDVNNIIVSAANNHFDVHDYLYNMPLTAVGEIHLAGHAIKPLIDGKTIRIDDHGSAVKEEVWDLFSATLEHAKQLIPTLIEWDTNVPEFHTLHQEALKAETLMTGFLELKHKSSKAY